MEYRKKCTICGCIFCYTDKDLDENTKNGALSALYGLSTIASVLGGGMTLQTMYGNEQGDKHAQRIKDYTKCPQCGSSSIVDYTPSDESKIERVPEPVAPTITINTNASSEALVKRATMFLEDHEWEKAEAYCEAALDAEPEYALAYLVKLLIEQKVDSVEKLYMSSIPLDKYTNYQRCVRFADAETKNQLETINARIIKRIDEVRKQEQITKADGLMSCSDIMSLQKAINIYDNYADDICCTEKIELCKQKIKDIERKEKQLQEERLREKEKEEERIKEKAIQLEKKKKKTRRIILLSLVCGIVVIGLTMSIYTLYKSLIRPNRQYNMAVTLMDEGKYDEAINMFDTILYYKDSSEKIKDIRYNLACTELSNGNYIESRDIFVSLQDYLDSHTKALECEEQYILYQYYQEKTDLSDTVSSLNTLYNNGYDKAEDDIIQISYDYIIDCINNDKYDDMIKDYLVYAKELSDAAIENKIFGEAEKLHEASLDVDALKWLELLSNTDDTESLENECMYSIVTKNYSDKYVFVYEYLTKLKERNYMDAEVLFNELYSDYTYESSIERYDTTHTDTEYVRSITKWLAVVHFVWNGGTPNIHERNFYICIKINGEVKYSETVTISRAETWEYQYHGTTNWFQSVILEVFDDNSDLVENKSVY